MEGYSGRSQYFERRGNEFVVAEEKNYLQIAAGWDRID